MKETDEASATPFDDYAGGNPNERPGSRKTRWSGAQAALRGVSGVSFVLAILCAFAILALDGAHSFGWLQDWKLKSAFPLIFVGISYGCLQFALPRSKREFLLSMAVAAAFVLWGAEQFVPVPALASLIDDVVVFLFVLDLSIVIRGYLKEKQA